MRNVLLIRRSHNRERSDKFRAVGKCRSCRVGGTWLNKTAVARKQRKRCTRRDREAHRAAGAVQQGRAYVGRNAKRCVARLRAADKSPTLQGDIGNGPCNVVADGQAQREYGIWEPVWSKT